MFDIRLEDSINKLNLSIRASNGLRIAGIYTIQQFLNADLERLGTQKGIGKKSLAEYRNSITWLKQDHQHLFYNDLTLSKQMSISDNIRTFTHNDGLEYYDIHLDDLNLNKRAYNCLRRAGIQYFSELINLTDDDLLSIRNLGVNSVTQIRGAILNTALKLSENIGRQTETTTENLNEINIEILQYISAVSKTLNLNELKILYMFKNPDFYAYLNPINQKIDLAFNQKTVLPLIMKDLDSNKRFIKFILHTVNINSFGITESDLFRNLPEVLQNESLLSDTLANLFTSQKIHAPFDNRIILKKPSFKEVALNILNKREYNVLIHRFSGKTLEEIGSIFDITRERVRQIEAKSIVKIDGADLEFEEDIYKYIYTNYSATKHDFVYIFGDEFLFNYLSTRYSKINKNNKNEFNLMIDDDIIPTAIKLKFEKVIFQNYVKIDKDRVKRTRSDIAFYIIKKYAKQTITFDYFKTQYFSVLKTLNLDSDSKFELYDRGFENRIQSSDYVLWTFGRKFRYYNMKIYDFDELLNILNFSSFEDVEYSSLKFFRSFPELMHDYDIHDEYELHNLLKKICSSNQYKDTYRYVKFNRMPNIEFGIANRNKQVKDLLFLHAPISKFELADLYEEEYGVNSNTFLANYVSDIERYKLNDMYIVDFPKIPDNIKQNLQNILVDDFYSLKTALFLIKAHVPDYDLSLLNALTLRSIGFKAYENFIVKTKYKSASIYFKSLLTKDDIINLNEISPEIRALGGFTAWLYKLKANYEIIEFLPNKFINTRVFIDNDININSFRVYCEDVTTYLGDHHFFTLHSLNRGGFLHSLYNLGFDDWFYTSILIEDKLNISYIKIGRNKLLYTDPQGFIFGYFLEQIVNEHPDMFINILDLNELLKTSYDIHTDNSSLINHIRSTELHYDPISKRIYINYEKYLEVI